jgi:hypothetical protein
MHPIQGVDGKSVLFFIDALLGGGRINSRGSRLHIWNRAPVLVVIPAFVRVSSLAVVATPALVAQREGYEGAQRDVRHGNVGMIVGMSIVAVPRGGGGRIIVVFVFVAMLDYVVVVVVRGYGTQVGASAKAAPRRHPPSPPSPIGSMIDHESIYPIDDEISGDQYLLLDEAAYRRWSAVVEGLAAIIIGQAAQHVQRYHAKMNEGQTSAVCIRILFRQLSEDGVGDVLQCPHQLSRFFFSVFSHLPRDISHSSREISFFSRHMIPTVEPLYRSTQKRRSSSQYPDSMVADRIKSG